MIVNSATSQLLPTLILILGNAVSYFGQSQPALKPEFAVFNLTGKGKSVVYAKEGDGLPNVVVAKGKIIDANVSGKYCGPIATAGTLKIELEQKIEQYADPFLYVVVLCLAGKENENLVGKNIEIEARKMTEFPYSFGVSLSNSLDSKGAPFYLSTVDGVGGLMKKLKTVSDKKNE